MLTFSKDCLYKRLIHDLEYDVHTAEATLKTIGSLDEKLQPAIDKWLSNKDTDANYFSYDGISLAVIQFRYRYDFIDSLYRMDSFIKDDVGRNKFKEALSSPVLLD